MSEEEFVEAIFQRDLKIKKLNEKIKELENKYSDEEIRNTVIKRCDEVIKKDYVSKDKIKAILKELEKEGKYHYEKFMNNDNKDFAIDGAVLQEIGAIEGMLRELLGGE